MNALDLSEDDEESSNDGLHDEVAPVAPEELDEGAIEHPEGSNRRTTRPVVRFASPIAQHQPSQAMQTSILKTTAVPKPSATRGRGRGRGKGKGKETETTSMPSVQGTDSSNGELNASIG